VRLLDTFCHCGGCSVGYARAGFHVTGVDIKIQKEYPFTCYQADAIEYIKEFGHLYDAIHASPPCQSSSNLTKGTNAKFGKEYPDLIAETRAVLEATGKPYIIENVEGAVLHNPVLLCGDMFDMRVIRHRLFETNWPLTQPAHPTSMRKHKGRVAGWRHGAWHEGPYFAVYGDGGGKGTLEQWQDAMGIDWVNRKSQLVEMVPPNFTEYIGIELMTYLHGGKHGNMV
jgi:site-specific DNA-cytosine methylase